MPMPPPPDPAAQRLRATDTEDQTRRDTAPAGSVLLTIVGVLSLAALMNAETMLHRAETSQLGPRRDLALMFWEPVEAAGSATRLTRPRAALDALRDGSSGGDPGGGHTVALAPADTSPGDTSLGEISPDPAGPTTGPRLGHRSVDPSELPVVVTTSPTGPTDPTSDLASDAVGDPPADPSDSQTTDLGLTLQPPTPPTTPAPSGPASDGLATPAVEAEAVPLRRPTTDDPLRVLIVGDSTMDSLGTSIMRDLAATGVTAAERDVRISTGLSRPDFFDWPGHLRQLTAVSDTEVVVIMFGANDAQPFIIDDSPENYGTERWFATYRARFVSLIDELTAAGRWVLWVSQPAMRNQEYDVRMQELNQLYAEELARYPTALYLDSRPLLTDENGEYSAYLVDGNGDRQLVRQTDGVHLTNVGGDRLSPLIVNEINRIAPLS